MTTITIQPNKIVSSGIKDNYTLLQPQYRKNLNKLFGQPNRKHLDPRRNQI